MFNWRIIFDKPTEISVALLLIILKNNNDIRLKSFAAGDT